MTLLELWDVAYLGSSAHDIKLGHGDHVVGVHDMACTMVYLVTMLSK